MRRYESYKDSGVEWLGEVPSYWEISSLGKILLSVSEKNRPDLPLLSITRELGVIERDTEDQDSNHNFIPDDLSNYKILKKGQFGMNKMKAWQGSYGVSDFTGIVSPAYYIFDFIKSINPQFFHWAIRSKIYVSFFGSASDGVRIGQWDLSKSRMKSIPFIIPSNDEQQKIAQFLDDKTAKIDQAVDLAEKEIALLKEHKQILIQNAVTRGLNPDVPLKDSGVEWIGQVPEHWDVKKLKFVSKINQHTLPENTNGSLSIKYVDIGSVSFENGIEKVENFLFKNAPSRARRLANRGDIVVSTVRTYLKAITMVKEEHQDCIFSTGFAVITSNECLEDNFFELYAKSDAFTEQVSVFSKGMSYPAINSTDLSNLWITVPPISEQQKIADYLETQVSKINQAIALKTAHIEKLKEYKSVLINDVVTGKVRV